MLMPSLNFPGQPHLMRIAQSICRSSRWTKWGVEAIVEGSIASSSYRWRISERYTQRVNMSPL
jgi:hypothetical protein